MSQSATGYNGYNAPRLIVEEGLMDFYAGIGVDNVEEYINTKRETCWRLENPERLADFLMGATRLVVGDRRTTLADCALLNACYFKKHQLHLESRHNTEKLADESAGFFSEKDEDQRVSTKYMKADEHMLATLGHIFEREGVDPDNFTYQNFTKMTATMAIVQ